MRKRLLNFSQLLCSTYKLYARDYDEYDYDHTKPPNWRNCTQIWTDESEEQQVSEAEHEEIWDIGGGKLIYEEPAPKLEAAEEAPSIFDPRFCENAPPLFCLVLSLSRF